MKPYLFLYIVIFFLLLTSCVKDDFSENGKTGFLLKEVVIGNEVYEQYTYTKSGLVLEEKSKFHYTKHFYNGREQLIQSDHYWDERVASSSSFILEEAMNRTEWVSPENTERDTYTTFEYDRTGKLSKMLYSSNNSYSTCLYKNGRIVKRTSFHENKATIFDNYFYDHSGNLIKTERFSILPNGDTVLQTTTEYEFDKNHNPYYPFRKMMIPGQNTNLNNIIKETYTLHFEVDSFIEPVQIKEYEYEYNSWGYPVKRNDGFGYFYE